METSKRKRPPTMRQIARLANVSVATVSYVLNDSPQGVVGEETSERVKAIAEQLNYQRSALTRAIKTPLKHIGIVVSARDEERYTYTAEVFRGVLEATNRAGYVPVLNHVDVTPEKVDDSPAIDQIIQMFRSKLIDGLVIDKAPWTTQSVVDLVRRGIPLVQINASRHVANFEGQPVPLVNCDNFMAAWIAMEHLVDLGHRHIACMLPAFLSRPKIYSHRATEFLNGARKALCDSGLDLPASHVVVGDLKDAQMVAEAMDQLFSLPKRPTAIFVADDSMAVLVMHAMADRGLHVPDDFSVVGCGDWPSVRHLARPKLTTVGLPLMENGRRAAELLIEIIETKACSSPEVILPPYFIDGDSTSPLGKGRRSAAKSMLPRR